MSATWLLVVDDDDDLRESLAEGLRARGFDVVAAPDGAVALRRLKDASTLPALVLLDLLMPVMTGREVLVAMRSAPRTLHLPVVVLSGVDTDGLGLDALGVAEVLHKPVSFEELLSALRRFAPAARG